MSDYLKDLETYSKEIPVVKSAEKPGKSFKPKPDPILLKLFPEPHPLSSEEQAFYIKITEGTFGFNEQVRNETLNILAQDHHVKFLAPYLCLFIKETVHVNIAFPDLSLLIYAVRMTKSLMGNMHVNLKEHLHILLPTIMSCVLSKKISKYSYDNHWTLRDFSAQVVSQLCYNYNNKINEIKKRIIKVYARGIQDSRKPLTTLYGSLKGLSCFGEETIRICVVPLLPVLSRRVCAILEKNIYMGEANIEMKQAQRIIDLILSITGPILLKYKNTSDGGVSYVKDFGYLGYSLYSHVKTLEKVEIDKRNNFNVFLVCPQ